VSRAEVSQLASTIREQPSSERRIAVLSAKGGVGKTTVAVGIGSVLSSLRGDPVLAVDACTDFGSLADRVGRQTASTVHDVAHHGQFASFGDFRRHVSRSATGLDVLASSIDPAMSEAFDADGFRRVSAVVSKFYGTVLTDSGTGLVHSVTAGVLGWADSIVVTTAPAIDGIESAVSTIEWLRAHGHSALLETAVVAIVNNRSESPPLSVQAVQEYFHGRVRAVQAIPYDPHLAIGGVISLDALAPATRAALLELTATVVSA